MATNLDVRFEEALARSTGLPSFLTDPTKSLENSSAVQSRLASLRPPSRFAVKQAAAKPASYHSTLPDLGPAPDFTDTQRWFNTPRGQPLSLAGLRGHVVLVDFWTYTCINCIRTLPFLKGLYATYRRAGLEVVGVETPEFTFEQDAANVQQAIRSDGIGYPVVQDNRYGTWNAYSNQYWPAEYLIDAHGEVRHTQFGEGDYRVTEDAVRSLLREAGAPALPAASAGHAIMPSAGLGTPETYLDDHRSQGFAQPLQSGTHSYPGVGQPAVNQFALRGTWNVSSESATPISSPGAIQAGFQAARVYLVLTSAGETPRRVEVQLDGHPIPAGQAGADVHQGAVTVRGQRLYSLVALPGDQQHALTVLVPPGVSAYDFTFG
jgi:thiol-disulfide isomerase/thioredoxin